MSALPLHEAVDVLRSLTPVGLQLFQASAAALALRYGDIAAGMVEALNLAALDHTKEGVN